MSAQKASFDPPGARTAWAMSPSPAARNAPSITYRPNTSSTSSVAVAIDHGDRVTCSTDLVMNGSPPTMSR
jgi:hypothetical protein